jgi:hypothetical protein
MPGPTPVPGEQVNIYDGSSVYWNLPKNPSEKPVVQFEALNGTLVTLSRQDGTIVP